MTFYWIYSAALEGLYYIKQAFEIFAGIRPIAYRGETMMIYDVLFTRSPVATVFWGVTALCFGLALVFSIVAVTKKAADLKMDKSLGATLGQIGRTMLMFLITPIMVIGILQITAIVMQKTDELFDTYHGGHRTDTAIFALTIKDAALENPGVVKDFAAGILDYRNEAAVRNNLDTDRMQIALGIFLTIALIIAYVLILAVLILRIFMLLILYIVSPFFISAMVFDGGGRYRSWRKALFAKMLSGYSLLISVKMVTYILIPFILSDIRLVPNPAGDMMLKGLFLFGSVYGAYKSVGILVSLLAPGMEGEDMLVLGMAVGGAVAAAKSLGKAALTAPLEAAKLGAEIIEETAKDIIKAVVMVVAKGVLSGGTMAPGEVAMQAAKVTGKTAAKSAKKAAKKVVKQTAKSSRDIAKKTIEATGKAMKQASENVDTSSFKGGADNGGGDEFQQ
ncbi:MAG: hypothetical protein LBC86_11085 [Oscillospiraceae bacterium]|jgi:hypothetical protein|nr:hypothetical protein [Oscillospiraceae bacterium]